MNKQHKIALINHGCAKNLVDSELMLGILAKNGINATLDETKADVVIINTCSFIHDAEKESVQSILQMIEEGKKVIITGCLPQKYNTELKQAIPEAAAMLGTSDIAKIAQTSDSYIVVYYDSIAGLIELVSAYLSEGYVLCGNLVVDSNEFYQPMIKYKK